MLFSVVNPTFAAEKDDLDKKIDYSSVDYASIVGRLGLDEFNHFIKEEKNKNPEFNRKY